MSNKADKGDFYSGIPWVYVTRAQAWAHPLGKLGILLWLIGLSFIAIAILKFYFIASSGGSWGLATFNAVFPLLTGIGLLMRVPWAIYLAVISAGLTIYALVRGFGQSQSIYYLIETIAYVGILFYLIDGDRPNLIYRHRYRKYSAARGEEPSEPAEKPVDS